ncbi:MAG: hypothetical protein EXR75_15665 [Myxococcales bacterium]|nr:hypothetical protein [Myxococcales bacterium]
MRSTAGERVNGAARAKRQRAVGSAARGRDTAIACVRGVAMGCALVLGVSSALAAGPTGAPAGKVPAAGNTAADAAPGEQAKALFAEGVAAYQARDFKKAHDRLSRALDLKKHFKIAVNLGATELELKMPREAAYHLAFALEELEKSDKAQPGDLAEVRDVLASAQKQLITAKVTISMFGEPRSEAVTKVDGAAVPHHLGLVFLTPPGGTVEGSVPSASALLAVTGVKGQTVDVQLALRPSGSAGVSAAELAKAGAAGKSKDAEAGTRPSWPIYVGVALAVAAGATAVATGVLAMTEGSAADEAAARVGQAAGERAATACPSAGPKLNADCTAWYGAEAMREDFLATAVGSAVGAAVGVLAVGSYWLTGSSGDAPKNSAALVITPFAVAAPGAVFLGARGQF